MKSYTVRTHNPLVNNVLIRLLINQYVAGKLNGMTLYTEKGVSALTRALLCDFEFDIYEDFLEDFEIYVSELPYASHKAFKDDLAVIVNWLKELRTGNASQLESVTPTPPPCKWDTEDAAMGCFILHKWAKEDLTEFEGPMSMRRGFADHASEIFEAFANGQLMNMDDHIYMDMDNIAVVQLIAVERFIKARMQSNHDEAQDAIRVLVTMSQLWFKLRNGMSLRLVSDIVQCGKVNINAETSISTPNTKV